MEQKNGAVVREYVGYDRPEGEALQESLAGVYRSLVPLLNFFMPAMKLESKVKAGSKEIKKYDAPRSLYQRLLESEALSPGVKAELRRQCVLTWWCFIWEKPFWPSPFPGPGTKRMAERTYESFFPGQNVPVVWRYSFRVVPLDSINWYSVQLRIQHSLFY